MHSLILYDKEKIEEKKLNIFEIIEIILNLKEKNSNIKFDIKINIEDIELEEYKLLMKLIFEGKKDEVIDSFENKYDLEEWVYVWYVLLHCLKKSI